MSFSSLPPGELTARLRRQLRDLEIRRFTEDLQSFRVVALEKVIQAIDDAEADAARAFGVAGGTDPDGDDFVATVNVRQGMLNLLAVFLWQLFETQRERLRAHSSEHGFESPRHSDSGDIEELRRAANAIKHGDGPSAEALRTLRPDLFRTPHWTSSDGEPESPSAFRPPRALVPLAGEGIYVRPDDLSRWLESVAAYWNEIRRE